jgi:DNA helicase TIP49 (TBP-interacting protein)
MATRKTTAKPKTETQAKDQSEAVTLEQALKEEGEGRTPETIKNEGRKTDGSSKMDKATKIMEEMWDDIQAGKVKRKDVIQRFMEEANLSKAGSSTYYGSIKAKLSKTA